MPIVGVDHHLPLLHLTKIVVSIYTTENTIHKFAIDCMINPSLHFNKISRTQVEKCLGCSFSNLTMKTIKNCRLKKNTSVMALIMIYENSGKTKKQCVECYVVLFILS